MNIYDKIIQSLNTNSVAILPPMDFSESSRILKNSHIRGACSILDPWYNRGFGGVLPEKEYDKFIHLLLNRSASFSNTIYLWGFPEIIGPYVRFAPKNFSVSSWLTWYYKNCPSVIRGWRSSQNACIQFTNEQSKLHPENFLTEEQKMRLKNGTMRFIPGPPTVIEEPLIVGFVGKKERTGHPSQKPEAVYSKLISMSTEEDDIIIDLMAGSGTTGSVAKQLKRRAILCDMNKDYVQMMEKRLGCQRISF